VLEPAVVEDEPDELDGSEVPEVPEVLGVFAGESEPEDEESPDALVDAGDVDSELVVRLSLR
jgi:hypothetical protein